MSLSRVGQAVYGYRDIGRAGWLVSMYWNYHANIYILRRGYNRVITLLYFCSFMLTGEEQMITSQTNGTMTIYRVLKER